MPVGEAHRDYLKLLIRNVGPQEHPSLRYLNRLEAAIQTREDAEAYLELLHSKCKEQRYPSLQMVDRIARITSLVMVADRIEEQRRELDEA
jgi:hypothetical protein